MPARSFPVGARSARAADDGGGGADAQATISAAPASAKAMRRMGLVHLAGRADPVDPLVDLSVVVARPNVVLRPSGSRAGAHDDRGRQGVTQADGGLGGFADLVFFEGLDVHLGRRAIDGLLEALLDLRVLLRATRCEDEQ